MRLSWSSLVSLTPSRSKSNGTSLDSTVARPPRLLAIPSNCCWHAVMSSSESWVGPGSCCCSDNSFCFAIKWSTSCSVNAAAPCFTMAFRSSSPSGKPSWAHSLTMSLPVSCRVWKAVVSSSTTLDGMAAATMSRLEAKISSACTMSTRGCSFANTSISCWSSGCRSSPSSRNTSANLMNSIQFSVSASCFRNTSPNLLSSSSVSQNASSHAWSSLACRSAPTS
mmetsp:Transcript_32573/g.68870  ORF Transcript_32573/g.68870 Transcript_32573/m.68870 type:complete len:224 (-) Transcript_32573:208-879(-)